MKLNPLIQNTATSFLPPPLSDRRCPKPNLPFTGKPRWLRSAETVLGVCLNSPQQGLSLQGEPHADSPASFKHSNLGSSVALCSFF